VLFLIALYTSYFDLLTLERIWKFSIKDWDVVDLEFMRSLGDSIEDGGDRKVIRISSIV